MEGLPAANSSGRAPIRRWATIAFRGVLVTTGVLVFLVLTGIIAEPETVMERIVRFVIGK